MKKGETTEVTFFGNDSVVGVVEAVDKASATVLFGKIRPGWTVTIPRAWIRKGKDRWSLDLA